jgi:hypothetical protein
MLFNGIARLASFLIFLDAPFKTPIPSEACCTGVLAQVGALLVVGVNLDFVAPSYFHRSSFSFGARRFCDHTIWR